ncbi:MAG: hypothetical protein M3R00_03950 [Pseudomonadota bacterium]|nr:hypothetical protein [Pseudomonadota bacterium]
MRDKKNTKASKGILPKQQQMTRAGRDREIYPQLHGRRPQPAVAEENVWEHLARRWHELSIGQRIALIVFG